jgi:hypothetical protein|tara:strand:- start:3102 stop:3515 length:414 start_codon:yes stop_codon:yes gene_type:complete
MTKKIKTPIVRNLDLSIADGYAITREDIIINAIREDGLADKDLLFSGLEGQDLDTLLVHGTIYPGSNFIYASPSLHRDHATAMEPDLIDYAVERFIPMFAVYDATKFTDIKNHRYEFLDKDNGSESLLAAYILKNVE